jgi:hypothetical protein
MKNIVIYLFLIIGFSSCLKDDISDVNIDEMNPFGSGNEYEGPDYLKFDSYFVEPDGVNYETFYIDFSIDWSQLPHITTKPNAIILDLACRYDLFTPDGDLLSSRSGFSPTTYSSRARFEDLPAGTVAGWDSIVVRAHPYLINSQYPTINVFYKFNIEL